VVHDNRACEPAGEGTNSSFEYAVSAAASVGMHLLRQSYHLQLALGMGATGDEPVVVERGDERTLLDRCAEVGPSGAPSLLPLIDRLGTSDQLIVAVLGSISRDEALQLARLRRRAVCLAVMVDSSSWASLSHRDRLAADAASAASALLLHQSGWRILRADRMTSLATAWSSLSEPSAFDTTASVPGGAR
jgi:uncharacterized protein (DUF58 family)